jgi:hypothetical protein
LALFQRKKNRENLGIFDGISCEISFEYKSCQYGVHGNLPAFSQEIVDGLNPAPAYLEARLTGTCQHVYSCVQSYEICELLQLFDPSFIEKNDITAAHVARLEVIVPFGAQPVLKEELQRDLHLYAAESPGFTIDHGDVGDFTAGILTWWKNHATEVGAWSGAAKIAFAMAPNSAGSSVLFSMLKTLFGSNQDSALADFICGSMMLHYNNSKRASEAAKA